MKGLRIALAVLLVLVSFVQLAAVVSNDGHATMMLVFICWGLAAWAYWPYRPSAIAKQKRQQEDLAVKQAAQRAELDRIHAGELPEARPSQVRLKDGEAAYYADEAVLYEKQTTGYESKSASVRVRVSKNVTIGSGGGRGKAVKENVPVSSGELMISNQRIVFAGNLKSFEFSLDKLTNHHVLADGVVVFHFGSKNYMMALPEFKTAIVSTLLQRI